MHFDAALNIAWLLLGAVALVSTLKVSRPGPFGRPSILPWLQLVGVGSVVIALFPYISASDDLIRIENARSQSEQQSSAPHNPASNLLRLYEVSDAPLVGHICSFAVTFVFLYILFVPVKGVVRRSVPLQSGRSPPIYLATA